MIQTDLCVCVCVCQGRIDILMAANLLRPCLCPATQVTTHFFSSVTNPFNICLHPYTIMYYIYVNPFSITFTILTNKLHLFLSHASFPIDLHILFKIVLFSFSFYFIDKKIMERFINGERTSISNSIFW
jgi:hypothetical protein